MTPNDQSLWLMTLSQHPMMSNTNPMHLIVILFSHYHSDNKTVLVVRWMPHPTNLHRLLMQQICDFQSKELRHKEEQNWGLQPSTALHIPVPPEITYWEQVGAIISCIVRVLSLRVPRMKRGKNHTLEIEDLIHSCLSWSHRKELICLQCILCTEWKDYMKPQLAN